MTELSNSMEERQLMLEQLANRVSTLEKVVLTLLEILNGSKQ